jgi:ribokinase
MSSVVVVGSINVDLVAVVPRLPAPGETALGRRIDRHGGGKGANAAVAAARLGADVALVGAVGADDLGDAALAELGAEGVDVSSVAVHDDEPTGTALIVVDEAGENQIAVGAGANAALGAAHVRRELAGRLDDCGCLLVSTEIPDDAVAAAVRAARERDVPCVLNPAPARASLLELAGAGPLLTPNTGEARRLAAGDTAEAAGAALAALTGAPVIVTLGAGGALLCLSDGGARSFPARPARAVDTTGAGDTFNGALAARLAAGDDVGAATAYALVAASLSVEMVGARGGMPSAAAVAAAG